MACLNKSLFRIVSQREVAPRSFRLVLEGDTSAITGSGQFVQVALPGRYLRRLPVRLSARMGTPIKPPVRLPLRCRLFRLPIRLGG